MAKIDEKKQYKATEALFVGRARAANPGDIIEGTTVKNHEAWHDKVEVVKADDPAAAAAPAGSSSAQA